MLVLLCIPHNSTAASNAPRLHELSVANHSKEKVIYPLTVNEIAEAQLSDLSIQKLTSDKKYTMLLVENTQVLCKGTAMVLPMALHYRAISLYHHYLQHPRASSLKETLRAAMYWTGMQNTVQKYVKNCHECQVNKRQKHKYGKLPTKLVIRNPWEVLCVDLIGPYTLKGKDKTEIYFMCRPSN